MLLTGKSNRTQGEEKMSKKSCSGHIVLKLFYISLIFLGFGFSSNLYPGGTVLAVLNKAPTVVKCSESAKCGANTIG